MARVTLVVGFVLIGLGLVGYVSSEPRAPTALIPAGFGVVLLLLGLLAFQEKMRKHAMHVAAMIGLLGFLGAGIMAVRAALSGEIERPIAVKMQVLMALTCAVFVGLCVKSFIDARKSRKAGSQPPDASA